MLQCKQPLDNEILVPKRTGRYRGNTEILVMRVNARCLHMPRFRGSSNNMILENLEKMNASMSLNNHQLLSDIIAHTFESIPVNRNANQNVKLVTSKNFQSTLKDGLVTIAKPLTIEVLLDGLLWLVTKKDDSEGRNHEKLNFMLLRSHYRTTRNTSEKILISSLAQNIQDAFLQALDVSSEKYTNIVTVESLFRVYLKKLSVTVPSTYWKLDEMEEFATDHDLVLTHFPEGFDTMMKRVAYMQHFYRKIPEMTKVMISIVDGQHRCQSWWYIHNHINPSICKAPAPPAYDKTVDQSMSKLYEEWDGVVVPTEHQHLEKNKMYVELEIPSVINDEFCKVSEDRSKELQWNQGKGKGHDFSTFLAECIDKLSTSDEDSDYFNECEEIINGLRRT